MKDNKNLKKLIVLIVAASVFGASLMIGFVSDSFENLGGFGKAMKLSGSTFLNVLVAVSFLVALNCGLQLLLGLLKKGSNRSKTMSTVISSLVKYAVVIVGFCL